LLLDKNLKIHSTAEVARDAEIGAGTAIWNEAQVREGARLGRECVLGKGVYVDAGVQIGDRVKLENRVSVFKGARLGTGVFVGPHSCLLNDRQPRAITPDGRLKGEADWTVSGVTVEEGASIGGGCTILPGITIGSYALVGAGSVVTRDVPPQGLVFGNPARLHGYVCPCGSRLDDLGSCRSCRRQFPQLRHGS
jgi:acetyltransferase-like isoleucine patch superfamily enzyme